MHIEINDHITLREIQDVFSEFYPFLKLEFFRKPHGLYEGSPEEERIFPGLSFGVFKKTHVSGMLEIQPLYTAADVEREFQQRFGLSAQICLKAKQGWDQTTGMDDFTLKELNELGRNSSDEYIVEDYEEGFEEEDGFDRPVIG